MRPIAVFTKSLLEDHAKSTFFSSINNELRSLHLALQYEYSLSPQVLGVTVSTKDEIYEKWRRFAEVCKSTNNTPNCGLISSSIDISASNFKSDRQQIPKLYALSLDIKRCFDTLPQDRLIRLTEDLLKEDSYVVKKFVKIKKIQAHATRTKYVSMATNGFDCTNFVAFVRQEMASGRIVARNVVFVDKVFYRAESREKLLALARKHIRCSVGFDGDRYLLQSTGMAWSRNLTNYDYFCNHTVTIFNPLSAGFFTVFVLGLLEGRVLHKGSS